MGLYPKHKSAAVASEAEKENREVTQSGVPDALNEQEG